MKIPSPLSVARTIAIYWVFSRVPIPFGLAPWVLGSGLNSWPQKVECSDKNDP